jgi:hypothetical protein
MTSGVTRNPLREDLCALRDELAEQVDVLVVDVLDPFRAEFADFPATEKDLLASGGVFMIGSLS